MLKIRITKSVEHSDRHAAGMQSPVHSRADQDIGWLNVTMDDSFLVGVLNGSAHLDEEPKSFFPRERVLVAEINDLHSANQFHHENGRPDSVAGIKDSCDVLRRFRATQTETENTPNPEPSVNIRP